jgi:hypothetical protein
MSLFELQTSEQGNREIPLRSFSKSLKPTPIYRRAPSKRLQRSLSEDTAKLERSGLRPKTALSPKMGAIYGGQANKKANQILYQPVQKLMPCASERQEPHLHTRESSTSCALRSMSFATLPDAGLLFLGSCLGSWRGSSDSVDWGIILWIVKGKGSCNLSNIQTN